MVTRGEGPWSSHGSDRVGAAVREPVVVVNVAE